VISLGTLAKEVPPKLVSDTSAQIYALSILARISNVLIESGFKDWIWAAKSMANVYENRTRVEAVYRNSFSESSIFEVAPTALFSPPGLQLPLTESVATRVRDSARSTMPSNIGISESVGNG
jgi:hypothetical protein